MELYQQHQADQLAAVRRGQVHIQTSYYQQQEDPTSRPWISPAQFDALQAWPGDRPIFPKGAAAPPPDEGNGDDDMAEPPADEMI